MIKNLNLSENALTVIKKRYLIKDRNLKPIETPLQMFQRVVDTVASAEELYTKNKTEINKIKEDFLDVLTGLEFLPNSPTFTGAGTKLGQLSACFVLPVEDDMTSILKTQMNMGIIHKSGGGTGFSFSRLRPKDDVVGTTGGISCGPMGFMQMYNDTTEQIKQGGTRRGANMGILRIDHPDILEFIDYKEKEGTLSNFNISVAVTEKFMRALKNNSSYELISPRTKKVIKKLKAKEVFDKIISAAWKNGEPGVIFIDQMNKFNPTPQLGEYESTNPCLAKTVRLATDKGLVTIEKLYQDQTKIKVVTDDRVPLLRDGVMNQKIGYTLYPAKPVFLTRKKARVFKLTTKYGYEILATDNHQFFTPKGPKQLKELKNGDQIILQSAGAWSTNKKMPKFLATNKLAARIKNNKCQLPKYWSREIGELLGWIMGDGWTTSYLPKGRTMPNHAVGLIFGNEEKKKIAPKLQKLIKEWFGLKGTVVERNNTLSLYYQSSLFYYLQALGFKSKKNIPESIWTAPREVILGFLNMLFTADGTVNLSSGKKSCSIRLSSSSKTLLQDVQLLLLNESIVSRLHLRRKKGFKLMPDSHRNPTLYPYREQYELIIDKINRDLFVEKIGFSSELKQKKVKEWIMNKEKKSDHENFITCIKEIKFLNRQDVYCTTEPKTHSIVANGFVTAQCGEQILLPYESCNLGSINLAKMVKQNEKGKTEIDWQKLEKTIKIAVRFLDDIIDVNQYPIPEIEEMTKGNRKIGLGVMGFADFLFQLEIPYNSNDAFKLAEKIMKFISEKGRETSIALAKEKGRFPNFEKSVWLKRKINLRNAAITTIAPTGTLSIIASCSSGIEPTFALAYTKTVMDGTPLPEINPYVLDYLKKNNLWSKEIEEKIKKDGNLKNTDLPEKIKKIFVTAPEIAPEDHVKMQAAFQKYTDNAISKTINFDNKATIDDVRKAYLLAYQLNCKGITIYRDGSRETQILTSGEKKDKATEAPAELQLTVKPRPRPNVVSGTTEEIPTSLGDLYVTVNEDGAGPFEVFARVGKSGGDAESMTEAIGRLISLALRSGIEIKSIVKQLKGIRGSQPVWQNGTLILSCPDAVGQALERYVKRKNTLDLKFENQIPKKETPAQLNMLLDGQSKKSIEGPKNKSLCPECGSIIEHEEGCLICKGCGYSKCG